MSSLEVRQDILKALDRMPLIQQIKLLEFINSMLAFQEKREPKAILKFAGIFDKQDVEDFQNALKDCEQIDEDEW